jgi:tetratricopeptide (TPR) repeat protein
MKTLLFTILFFHLILSYLPAQNISQDTILANAYFQKAVQFEQKKQLDSALVWYSQSMSMYFRSNYFAKEFEAFSKIYFIKLDKEDFENLDIFLKKMKTYYIQNKHLTTEYLGYVYARLGQVNEYRGRYDSSLFYHQKALTLRKSFYKNEHLKIAESINDIGVVYYYLGRNKEMIENFKLSTSIKERLLGLNNPKLSRSYNNIGVAFETIAMFDSAIVYYNKALELVKTNENDLESVGDLLNNLGNINRKIGNYDKAISYLNQAIDTYIRTYSNENRVIADTYHNLSMIYIGKNDFFNGEIYLDKAIKYYEQNFKEGHPNIATFYQTKGNFKTIQKKYNIALSYHLKSYDIRLKLLGSEHPHLMLSLNNIAISYKELKEYDKALQAIELAIETGVKKLGAEHIDIAPSYSTKGNIYALLGKYDQAIEWEQKSNFILRKIDSTHIHIGNGYQNIGNYYFESEKLDIALDYYLKAIRIYIKHKGFMDNNLIDTYLSISKLYMEKNKLDSAEYYCDLGIMVKKIDKNNVIDNIKKLNISQFYIDNYSIAKLINQKIKLIKSKNETQDIQNLIMLNDSIIHIINTKTTNIDDRLALAFKVSEIYQNLLDITSPDSTSYLAFYLSERKKASILVSAMQEAEAQSYADIPDSLLIQERGLKIDIAYYEQKLAEKPDSSIEMYMREKLFATNRKYEALIVRFEREFPDYYRLKYQNSRLVLF